MYTIKINTHPKKKEIVTCCQKPAQTDQDATSIRTGKNL
jgi:hypothetical protein